MCNYVSNASHCFRNNFELKKIICAQQHFIWDRISSIVARSMMKSAGLQMQLWVPERAADGD